MNARIVNLFKTLAAAALVTCPLAGAAEPARPDAGAPLTFDYIEEHLYAQDAAAIVIAQVRDEPITLRELGAALSGAHASHDKEAKVAKIDFGPIIDRVIDARIIAREARDMGMDAQPEFKKAVEEFKNNAAQEVLKQQVTAGIRPDPAEVERTYRDATREWKVKSVLVTSEDDAKKLVASVKAGKSFDALVKQLVAAKKARGGEDAQFLPRPRLYAPIEAALKQLKQGEVSQPIQVPGGFAVVKYEDVRYPDDVKARADAEGASVGRQKREAMEKYYAALIKRYVKIDDKVLAGLDFEAKEPGFEALRKDTRVLAEIKGAPSITVADLAAALAESFFHGTDRAADQKKINRQKMAGFDALVSQRVVPLEIAAERITERPEFQLRVFDYVNSALFTKFIEMVIVPSLKLDEAAARKYFEKHKKDYTFPAFYTLESLAFTNVKEAQAALVKLQAKTDFKWLNANADGQVKPADRKLEISGTLSAKGIPADLAALLANAKKDDFRLYAGPEAQFYVIHVIEVTPSTVQPFEDARAAVNDKLFPEQLNAGVREWAAKLRKAHGVKIFVEKGR